MRIAYGKLNILVLFLCLALGSVTVMGANRLFLTPLQAEKENTQTTLQENTQMRDDLRQEKAQHDKPEEITKPLVDIQTVIPSGNLQPESLLLTLADAANESGITVTDHRFGSLIPIIMHTEEQDQEEVEGPTLMRTNVTLSLEGDNEAQFQEFIALLEQTSRLIQVETFSVDQVPSRTAARLTNQSIPVNLSTFDLEVATMNFNKGGETVTEDEESQLLDEENNIEITQEEEETSATENQPELVLDPEDVLETTPEVGEQSQGEQESIALTPPPRSMRASVTIVVYFFET